MSTYSSAAAIKEFNEQKKNINDYCNKYIENDFYFNLDGVVNISEWKKNNRKVCFFLKECYRSKRNVYAQSYIYPLIKELKECEPWGMWKKVAKWSYLINNIENIETTKDINFNCFSSKKAIQKISTINIIKSIKNNHQMNEDMSIGNKTTSYKTLKNFMRDDAELLLRQLHTINPKIIICGNNFSLFIKLLMFKDEIIELDEFLNCDYIGKNKKVDEYLKSKFQKIESFIYYNDDYIIIDEYHPSSYKNEITDKIIIALKVCIK
jgi:hypothetical protein